MTEALRPTDPPVWTRLIEDIKRFARFWRWSDQTITSKVIEGFSDDELIELARLLITGVVCDVRRSITVEIERNNLPARIGKDVPDTAVGQVTILPRKETKEERDARFERDREEKLAREAQFRQKMESITKDYRKKVIDNWTEELLNTPFATGDGRRITWGEATVDDHEMRIAMLYRQISGTASDVARHEKAVEVLETSGKKSLNQYMEEAG